MLEQLKGIISTKVESKETLEEVLKFLGETFDGTALFVDEKYSEQKLDALLRGVKSSTISPIMTNEKKLGTLVIYSKEHQLSEEDMMAIKWSELVVTILARQIQGDHLRDIKIAKNAIALLSYSELEAVLYIFEEIKEEGLIVAAKIADKSGISRTVISTAIRKIESAGVIEARSLGVKGTFIKVLNNKIIEELNKIRV